MDNKLKHLEFIQNVIERMNNNSICYSIFTRLPRVVLKHVTYCSRNRSSIVVLHETV